jgi:hypothetical protein
MAEPLHQAHRHGKDHPHQSHGDGYAQSGRHASGIQSKVARYCQKPQDKIDPHLFSPAEVTLVNLDSGHAFHYGTCLPEIFRDWQMT